MTSEPTIKLPRAPAPPRARIACPGLTKAGLPCGANPTADGSCVNHSPRFTADDRRSWGRRGALSNVRKLTRKRLRDAVAALPALPDDSPPSFATAASVRTYLERMSKRVEEAKLAPSQAGAIARFADLAIRLAELELERETLDLEIKAQERSEKDRGQRVRVR